VTSKEEKGGVRGRGELVCQNAKRKGAKNKPPAHIKRGEAKTKGKAKRETESGRQKGRVKSKKRQSGGGEKEEKRRKTH